MVFEEGLFTFNFLCLYSLGYTVEVHPSNYYHSFNHLCRFDVKIAAAVAEETSLPFVTAENKFEALVGIQFPTSYFFISLIPCIRT